jgi:hypothetical protein
MLWGLAWLTWVGIGFGVWILPVLIATMIGRSKGIGFKGFLLGFFLSWVGVLIAAVLEGKGYEGR